MARAGKPCLIPLSRGKFAVVDQEDYPLVSALKPWYAERVVRKTRTIWYAVHLGVGQGRSKITRMHRLILNAPRELVVDHKDGNGLNNTRANIRLCTLSQNRQNGWKSKGKSKYKGVWWCRAVGAWQCAIRVSKQRMHLGTFANEKDAARAYDAAAKRFFGEFAKLNLEV